MNANCQNRQKCQNPTLADEIQLWRISKDEEGAALDWELIRENPQSKKDLVPWLQLSVDERKKAVERYKRKINSLHIPCHEEVKTLFTDKNMQHWPGEIHNPSEGEYASALYDDEVDFIKKVTGGFVAEPKRKAFAVSISPRANKKDIMKAFERIVDQLIERKSGTQKDSDIARNLQSLAVYRAKLMQKSGNWMRHFKGTPYAGTESKQKSRIRSIQKKIKGA